MGKERMTTEATLSPEVTKATPARKLGYFEERQQNAEKTANGVQKLLTAFLARRVTVYKAPRLVRKPTA